MTEYVERKKLEETFDNADPDVCESNFDGYSEWGFGRENVRNVIRSVPHAMGGISAKCSACSKNVQYLGNPLNYCPHCGAKMDSVKNKENVRINNV